MNVAIITAGGIGRRFGGDTPKQLLKVDGRTLLEWSILPFYRHPEVRLIMVTLPEDLVPSYRHELSRIFPDKDLQVVAGGRERQESVFNALQACPGGTSMVLIHDGVRPLIRKQDIDRLLSAARLHQAAIPVSPVGDTIKAVNGGFVERTIPRDGLWRVFTPQVFDYQLLWELHRHARQDGLAFTDDAGLCEHYHRPVATVEVWGANLKVTRPDDFLGLAAKLKEMYGDNL